MTINVHCIHHQESGWQEEWNNLVSLLLYGEESSSSSNNDDKKQSPLYQACRFVISKSKFTPNDFDTEIDDFSSYMMEKYQFKVYNKKLFDNYDFTQSDPIKFLCSRRYLQTEYQNYRRTPKYQYGHITKRKKKQGEKGYKTESIPVCSYEEIEAEKIYGSSKENPQKILEERENQDRDTLSLQRLTQNLVLHHLPKEGGRIYEQGGLQLYPSLSPTEETMKKWRLFTLLHLSKRHQLSEEETDTLLRDKHKNAQDQICEQIRILDMALKKKNHKKNAFKEKETKQRDACIWNMLFCPLPPAVVAQLLQIEFNNAEQCISRYKNFFHSDFDALKEAAFSLDSFKE